VNIGGFGTAVVDADLDQNILRRVLRVFHEHVEVTVLVKHAGIDQFVLEFVAAALAVGPHQFVIGVGGLRILIEILQVGVSRRTVEVEVVFFDVLAVVAFAVSKSEHTLLKDGILPIPKREREAKPLLVVGDPR